MKKKLLVYLLVFIVIVFAGCGKSENAVETTIEESVPGFDPDFVFETEAVEDIQATSATEPVATDVETETAPEETKAAEVTEATEATEDGTGSTESTAPAETTEPTSSESSGEEVVGTTAYEQYNAMSAKQQEEFVNSFDSITDFIAWYNAAKAEYEALHPDIEIGDGTIDLGEIAGGNG